MILVVYLIDNENPVIYCPANQTIILDVPDLSTSIQWDSPSASTSIQWDSPSAIDNSGDQPTINCNPYSGSSFDIGSTPVICTARDVSGNEGYCSFYIDITSKDFLDKKG